MRTQKEIIDYLGLEEENNNAELIKTALEIEKQFESQLKIGRLEDSMYKLNPVYTKNDIVLYEKILDSKYI